MTVTLPTGAAQQPVSGLLDGHEMCDIEMNNTNGICIWET